MAVSFHINEWSDKYGTFNGICYVLNGLCAMYIEPFLCITFISYMVEIEAYMLNFRLERKTKTTA